VCEQRWRAALTRSRPEDTPLIELLDERRHLLAVAMERLESPPRAEEVLQRVYGHWFGLAPQEREHLSPARPWLTRLVDRICAESIRSAPGTPGAGRVGIDSLPARSDNGVASPPGAPLPDRHAGLVHTFALACRTDNRPALDAVLALDVTALVDAGGRLRVDPSPAHGVEDVSRLLRSLLSRQPELVMTAQSVNGTTGLVGRRDIAVVAVMSLEIVGNRIHQVCIVLNPDKLRSWNRG
jgi:RNA polymerase sigma-70 factor (ECF subfamily)